MHICYLINQLAPGGAPTLLLDIVRNAEDSNVSFSICFLEGEDELAPKFRDAGATVADMNAEFKFDPRALGRLARFFRSRDFDLIHAHLPYSQTLGRLLAPRGTPVVSTQHNVPSNYHPVTRTLERITRPLDWATIACSEGVERAFRGDTHRFDGTLDAQWATIYNGIDIHGFERSVDDADGASIRRTFDVGDNLLFLNIARYVSAKSQEDIISAMERVVEDQDAYALLVGWGERESRLRSAVTDRDLNHRITVTGRVPAVHPYYAAADVFVSSSTFEGLPITHLEAMAAGLPVVATDIPGVREVVEEDVTGKLVPAGEPDALAEAMIALADERLRAELGSNGRALLEAEFSIERTVESHLTLYEGLLER